MTEIAAPPLPRRAAIERPSGPVRTVMVIEPGAANRNYWRDLWRYRELMFFLAWRDVAVRYKQTAIGIAWAVLRPALTMLVFVGFRRLVHMPAGVVPEPVLVFAAVLSWQLFSTALGDAASSVLGNASLITKVYFPRLVIPCAALLASLVDFLVTLALMVMLMAWYGFAPGWQLAMLPAFILLTLGLALGLGLFLAALNVKYRDFRYVVPFILQLGLFLSPVAFSTADVPPEWRMVYALNPLVGIIDGFRWSLLGGTAPLDLYSIGFASGLAAAMLVLGFWYFRRMERGFADLI